MYPGLAFVTVAYNTADLDNDGSGDGSGFSDWGDLSMTNTIVAENSDKSGEDPDCRSGPGGTTMSGDYDLLGTGDSANCTFVSQANDLVSTTASPIDTKNSGCQLNTRAVA